MRVIGACRHARRVIVSATPSTCDDLRAPPASARTSDRRPSDRGSSCSSRVTSGERDPSARSGARARRRRPASRRVRRDATRATRGRRRCRRRRAGERAIVDAPHRTSDHDTGSPRASERRRGRERRALSDLQHDARRVLGDHDARHRPAGTIASTAIESARPVDDPRDDPRRARRDGRGRAQPSPRRRS